MSATYQISLHSVKAGTPFQNDYIFLTPSTDATYAEALELGNAFVGSSPYADYLNLLPTDVTVQGITCRSVIMDGGSSSATATVVIPMADPGTRVPAAGSGQVSNQNGPMISFIPALEPGERARVNKSFIPTLNESDGEDDMIGGSLLSALDAFRTTMAAGIALTASTAQWIAVIKKIVEVSPGVFAPVKFARAIQKSISEAFVASQRRRRPKVF